MAVSSIAHLPNLTSTDVRRVFEQHFPQYAVGEVVDLPSWLNKRFARRDFMIRRTPWVCASIGLRQESGSTKLVYTGHASSYVRNVIANLSVGLWSMLFWNGIVRDVRKFIASRLELGQRTGTP